MKIICTRTFLGFTMHRWVSAFLSPFLLVGTGCRVVQKAVDAPSQTVRAVTPGKKQQQSVDPVELQQTLLRFADEFFPHVALGVDKLRRGTNELARAEALQWKIALGTETCSIASGANPMADLLAMTVFVTVSRAALEEHWQPKVFGPSAQPLLEVCRNGETEIWRIAGTFLKAPEQAELREAIDRWRRENPQPEEVPAVRALGLASQVAKSSKSGTSSKTSVFSLLNLDPLSGLDPATREIAQARLFAERALFVSQKMPVLLRWQTELLSDNAVAQPTVQQLVTNSTQIAVSVERFAAVAEKLSGQLSTEREEIFKALEAQEKNLTPLVSDMRQTLTAGSQMSTSLNTTLTTFDALMQRFGVGETNRAPTPNTNTEPFRIRDYGQAAIQLEATARQMTELFRTFDQTLASTNLSQVSERFAPAVQQAQIHGKELVDYAFWKGLLLVAIVLAASLLYRFLVPRMCPVANPK